MRTGVSEALISAVKDLFHQTLLNDTQIAARLLEQGLTNNRRQVRSIRLKSGWLRVTHLAPDRAARAAATFQQVEQVLTTAQVAPSVGAGWSPIFVNTVASKPTKATSLPPKGSLIPRELLPGDPGAVKSA